MKSADDPLSAAGSGPRLFSVGYSHQNLGTFLDLLRRAGIEAVADVRSAPYSRRLPHFNRPELKAALKENGLLYVYLGDLLGGRPSQADLYDAEGRVDYQKVRRTPFFRQGLERLVCGSQRYRLAMMCGEADALDCHRGLMITPALVECGV